MAWVEMRWHGKGWGGRGCRINLQHLHTVCLSPSRVQHWISTSKFPTFRINHFSKPSGCSVAHTIWTTPVLNKFYIFFFYHPPLSTPADYPWTSIMKFQNLLTLWPKMPFSPNFPNLEKGTSVFPKFPTLQ